MKIAGEDLVRVRGCIMPLSSRVESDIRYGSQHTQMDFVALRAMCTIAFLLVDKPQDVGLVCWPQYSGSPAEWIDRSGLEQGRIAKEGMK